MSQKILEKVEQIKLVVELPDTVILIFGVGYFNYDCARIAMA